MQYPKNRRQKSNKEERSQDFPLSDDMFRAAPTEVGGPRRGRLIHWLNLPGDSPDRLFCFLRGMKKAQICLLCLLLCRLVYSDFLGIVLRMSIFDIAI
jgi:hypothetical protein